MAWQRVRKVYRAAVSLALALAALLQPAAAAARSGEITNLSGAVVVRGADGVSRVVSLKSAVNEGDLLLTAENSYVRVKFTDGAEVVLRPNSQLKIDSYRFDEKSPAGDGALLSLF